MATQTIIDRPKEKLVVLATTVRGALPQKDVWQPSRMSFLAEAVGTYCLVFAGTGAAVANQVSKGAVTSLGVGLVFGLVAAAMSYTFGTASGAHMNPAVTFGLWVRGRHQTANLLPYVAAQVIGAVLASLTLKLAFAGQAVGLGLAAPAGPWAQSFLMEAVLTFILVLTVIGATSDYRSKNALAGLAVGAALALGVTVGGPISGGSLNPARAFGPALATGRFGYQWLYWLAPLLGAYGAAWVHRTTVTQEPSPCP